MVERIDAVVIGAGVVGLAIGRALAKAGREVIVLEKNKAFGEETSSRNSEVIHAGIQYRPGGVRAELAVKGRDALYAYCADHRVEHQRCGKLLVAIGEEETSRLSALKSRAEENGVDDLHFLSAEDAKALEPQIKCDAALFSPSSGVVDSHGLMLALLGDIEDAGGALALASPVKSGRVIDGGVKLDVGGADPMTIAAKLVVNSAGLWSDRVAHAIKGVPPSSIPALQYARGQYFTCSGRAPFSRLIYPLPSPDSQGVHYTRDLGGQAKLGPDIEFIKTNDDYSVDESRREKFAEAARRFWPAIDAAKLVPGYAGIRPKIAGPGEEGDFRIDSETVHGVPGYIGLYGIESPGLTTCLAIADRVASLAG